MQTRRILNGLMAAALVAGATASALSLAAMTPDDLKRLDEPLTPLGAERAGNKDG